MNERFAQMARQVRDVWRQIPPRRRLLLGGVAGTVLIVMVAVSFGLRGSGGREVLFSNLSAVDAAEVLRELDERGISYQIVQGADGRASILVPSSSVYRTRIDLAAAGLPRQGSVGFEIFDETRLGMTDEVRRINLRRALSGELERTIRALDVVQDARVQISLPENRLFISQQLEPSAAVMVTLKPGARLGPEQVRAIQRLVAATVEGLSPDSVFVADSRGIPLSDQLSQLTGGGGLTTVEQQLLIQQAVSNEYSRQIRSLLEGPFGPGAVEAMVKVELNFEKAEEIISAFTAPSGSRGIPRSEQEIEERFSGSGVPPGGVPGVTSNIPGYPALTASGESELSRFERIVNYEINETQTRREIPPGAIRRVTAAVLIDGELSEEQKLSVANALTMALGLDASRGDQIHVDAMPFVGRPTLATSAVETAPRLSAAWYIAAIAALLLVVVLLFLRRQERAQQSSQVDLVIADEFEAAVDTPSAAQSERVREQVRALARERPDDFARLLRIWLAED